MALQNAPTPVQSSDNSAIKVGSNTFYVQTNIMRRKKAYFKTHNKVCIPEIFNTNISH